MKQYVKVEKSFSNHSFSRSIYLVFHKIENLFFCFLCILLMILSQLNPSLTNRISFFFTNISLPIVQIAQFPFALITNASSNIHELSIAKSENQELKQELSKLKRIQIESINIKQENQELKKILNFAYAKAINFKTAQIVGRTNDIFNQNIFINAGKNQNIKEGSIVTGNNGVIGRISQIHNNKSRLILINDANSRIPIIASKSRTRAILSGNGSNEMELLYLPKKHNIKTGELIFTSGDGDTLPPGLLAGAVTKVTNNKVFVKPAQNSHNTDIVLIVEY